MLLGKVGVDWAAELTACQAGKYSPMDLLSVSNMINYFGKTASFETVDLWPILLRKGNTKVALYGLGNIRDERLHHLFVDNKIRWYS